MKKMTYIIIGIVVVLVIVGIVIFKGIGGNKTINQIDSITGGINEKNVFSEQYLPIISAIERQDVKKMNSLINTENINTRGIKDITFVSYSFLKNKKESFKWLVNHGADVNIPFGDKDNGFTHMINIATEQDYDFYFNILLKKADLAVLDERGSSPLHNAIYVANFKRLNLLIENGADINTPDSDGQTPLFFLCHLIYYEQAYNLLMKGANPSIPNKFGKTVASIVEQEDFPVKSEAYMWQQKTKEELIKQGIVFPVKRP